MKHDGEGHNAVSAQIILNKMSRLNMLTAVAVHGVCCTLVKTSVCSEMHVYVFVPAPGISWLHAVQGSVVCGDQKTRQY
jgi:CO dehydrogenase/acetyl-CoA synthase alpha subunit